MNQFSRCFTASSLWNELKELEGRVEILVQKNSSGSIDNVKIIKVKNVRR